MTIRYLLPMRLGVNCDMYKRSTKTLLELFKHLLGDLTVMGSFGVPILIAMKILDFLNRTANLFVYSVSVALLVLSGIIVLRNFYEDITDFMSEDIVSFLGRVLGPSKKAEKWAIALGWWIPRKYRGAVVGDILEDCHEMREKGCGEWRIRIQVLWQWAIAFGTAVPAVMIATLWQIVSPPK